MPLYDEQYTGAMLMTKQRQISRSHCCECLPVVHANCAAAGRQHVLARWCTTSVAGSGEPIVRLPGVPCNVICSKTCECVSRQQSEEQGPRHPVRHHWHSRARTQHVCDVDLCGHKSEKVPAPSWPLMPKSHIEDPVSQLSDGGGPWEQRRPHRTCSSSHR